MATILFDGVAYGMTLFVLSVGLGVTLGLMNFVNLAHGAFAMLGGYVAALAMARAGAPFLLALPLAFAASALVGAALERTLYRRLYGAHPLDQVLFTIGLVFMATPTANWFLGDQPYQVRPPAWLETRVHLGALEFGAY
ncbi:MAG: branched-chain amino acid ABC transporter permease, partial [Hyphomicrobiales bacterium]|nr:branched-chain amino acid ABC transporter permease [Hyphomicrobiales bacterium]